MARLYARGEKINNYIIDKLIDVGEFSLAYSAFNDDGDKRFLKLFKSPNASTVSKFRSFVEHQRILKEKLDDIINAETIYEVFEVEDMFHCQIKEFLIGETLNDFIVSNNPSINERLQLSLALIEAIKQIHQAGIVHTDLKKEHVFITSGYGCDDEHNIRIIDFDFSRIPNHCEPAYSVTTPFYSSPEHLKGETVDFDSDVFSLGIILYELLCNDYPYEVEKGPADYPNKVMQHAIRNKPYFINPRIGVEFSDMIICMLHPEPRIRPSLQEVHNTIIDDRL